MSEVTLSVVAPCFNEEETLHALYGRVREACEDAVGDGFEIVLVDDGSTDATWPIITELASADPRVRGVKLSRNHGHQLALTAGLAEARGERILMIDADLQDPPELARDMMALMDQGADVVYGKRVSREGESGFKKLSAALFYRTIAWLSDVDIPVDTGDFRMVSRQVLDDFLQMKERHRFVRGMIAWVGHEQVALEYAREARYAGETKYPLRKMLKFAGDAITGFSIAPLRLATTISYLALFAAFVLAAVVLVAVVQGRTVPGWASITLVISFFSGVQLLSLGIIGEYLGRLYLEAKGRPLTIVSRRTYDTRSGAARQPPTQEADDGGVRRIS